MAGAHFVFNSVTGLITLILIYPLANMVDYIANLIDISEDDYVLKLALFHTIFNVIGVLIMIPFISRLEGYLLRFFKDKPDSDIDVPKFLNEAVLRVPSSLTFSLLNESKYLYKNAIFEIVAHGMNIHREDIISDKKLKKLSGAQGKKCKLMWKNFIIKRLKRYTEKFWVMLQRLRALLNYLKIKIK